MKVPTYQNTEGLAVPRVPVPQQPRAERAAFGEEVHAANAEIAGQIGKIAGLLQTRVEERQKAEAETLNESLDYQWLAEEQSFLLGSDGILNLVGDQTVGITQKYAKLYNDNIGNVLNQQPHPDYRNKLEAGFKKNYLAKQKIVVKHEAQEWRKAKAEQYDSGIKMTISEAYSAQDPLMLKALMAKVGFQTKNLNSFNGIEDKGAIKDNAKSVVDKAIASSIASDSTGTEATALLSEVKDGLRKEDYDDIKDTINKEVTRREKENKYITKKAESLSEEEMAGLTIDNKMTIEKLPEFRGKVSEKSYLAHKKAILSDKKVNAVAQAETYNKLQDDLIRLSITDKDAGETESSLENIAKFRVDVINAWGEGTITAADGKKMLRDVSVAFDVKARQGVEKELNGLQKLWGWMWDLDTEGEVNEEAAEEEKMRATREYRERIDNREKPEDVVKDIITNRAVTKDPTLGFDEDEILKNMQIKEEEEADQRAKDNLSFNFDTLNPFGVDEAEAGEEKDDTVPFMDQDFGKHSLAIKHLAGAIGTKLVDIASGGMDIKEADELYQAFRESGGQIVEDIFTVAQSMVMQAGDEVKGLKRFLSDPIKTMNKILQGKSDDELKDQALKYQRGREATWRLIGKVFQPIGRVIQGTRAALGEGIDEVKEGEPLSVADMLQSGVKGFLKPEEVDSLISRIPFQEWEHGSTIRLAPRAVAEAIEIFTIAELTLGLPSKIKGIKRTYAKKDLDKAFNNARNNPQMREDFTEWLASRGAFDKTKVGGDVKQIVDDALNMFEIRLKQNPKELKRVLDMLSKKQTFGKLLKDKLSEEVGTLKFVPEVAPLKSNLQAVSQFKMPGIVTAEQAIRTLTNAGVSKEEIEFSGVEEFVKKKGKVTRDELVDYIEKNKVVVEPVVKGENVQQINRDSPYAIPEVVALAKDWHGYADDALLLTLENDGDIYRALSKKYPELIEKENWAEIVANDVFGTTENVTDTKFQKYTLPGGENYQETVLTLPGKELTKLPEGYGLIHDSNAKEGREWAIVPNEQKHGKALYNWHTTKEAAVAEAVANLGRETGRVYKSTHWDEPNPLVHHRTNQRQDAQGNTGTFIEEIQSDWHREGKSKGYGNIAEKATQFPNGTWRVEIGDTSGTVNVAYDTAEEAISAFKKEYPEAIQQARTGVPNAPFKNTWHELALKDIIRQAVERGDKFVAFISGEQTADRYNLSKQIDKIDYAKSGDTYDIFAIKGDDTVISKLNQSESDLQNLVGKDITKKIVEGQGVKADFTTKPEMTGKKGKSLSGVDLKVGGEWAKKFYDEILPRAAGKYVKKWGSKIEDINIGVLVKPPEAIIDHRYDNNWYTKDELMSIQESKLDGKFRVYDNRGDIPKQVGITDTLGKARTILVDFVKTIPAKSTQKGFYITPQMVKEVSEVGQPMFGNRLEGTLLQKLQTEKGTAGVEGSEPLPDDWEGKPAIIDAIEAPPAKPPKKPPTATDGEEFDELGKKLAQPLPKGKVKGVVREATGQKTGEEPTIKESKALKQSLKRQSQAARKAGVETKKEVKEIHKTIQKIKKMPIEGMGHEERAKIDELKKELKGTRTVQGLRELVKKVEDLKEQGKTKYIATKNLKDEQFKIDKEVLLKTRDVSPATQQPKVKATKIVSEKGKVKKTALATTLRPTRILDALDGGQNFEGPYNKFFYDRANRAVNESMARERDRRNSFLNFLKDNDTKLSDLAKTKTIDDVKYTVGEMIGVYNSLKNPEKTKAMIFGNKISKELANKIVSELSETEKAIGDYIMKDYQDNRERLRKAFIDYTDGKHDLGQVEGYSPIKRLSETYEPTDKEVLNEMIERQNLQKTYAERGFTKGRKQIGEKHQAPIILDEVSLFFDHISKVEHFISHGSLIKEMQRMVSDKEFATSIINDKKFGSPYYEALKNWVNRVANHDIYKSYYQLDKMAPALRRNAAVAYLAYNAVTIGKQFPSLALFLNETTMPRLLAGMYEMTTNYKEAVDLMHKMSPQMENRSIEREMEEFKRNNFDGYKKIVKAVGEEGFRGIFLMDHFVVGSGWHAVYNDSLALGFSEAEAAEMAEKAVFRTQPAAHAKDIAELYATSEFLNWFTQFSNQLNNIYNVVTYDIPMRARMGKKADALRGFLGVILSQMLIYSISKGRLAKIGDAKDFVTESTLNLIPLAGRMLNSQRKGFDTVSVPALSFIKTTGEAGRYAYKGVAEPTKGQRIKRGEYRMRALEKILETGALISGAPFSQPKKTLKGGARLISGDTEDLRELIWSKYILKEKKKKSKYKKRVR